MAIMKVMTTNATQRSWTNSQQPLSDLVTVFWSQHLPRLIHPTNEINQFVSYQYCKSTLCFQMDPRYAHKSDLKLSEMFFNPDRLYEAGMLDDLIRGIATTSMETMDQVNNCSLKNLSYPILTRVVICSSSRTKLLTICLKTRKGHIQAWILPP